MTCAKQQHGNEPLGGSRRAACACGKVRGLKADARCAVCAWRDTGEPPPCYDVCPGRCTCWRQAALTQAAGAGGGALQALANKPAGCWRTACHCHGGQRLRGAELSVGSEAVAHRAGAAEGGASVGRASKRARRGGLAPGAGLLRALFPKKTISFNV